MKQTTKETYRYSKPSPWFLRQLKINRIDTSWFKWEDMVGRTITREEHEKISKV